jgi:glycerol-3-phosphate dehydrogenase
VDADVFDRTEALRRLEDETFDLLVIGGGATGAGVALDAASRGLRTALVERRDFSSGTSSSSSKMVHGGLRYLQQGDVRLVQQSLRERQRLLKNAPHLVTELGFLIPIYRRWGLAGKAFARLLGLGLAYYDLTGGWRIGRRHRRLRADKAIAHIPTLRRDLIGSAYLYYDAQVDDARLTLAIVRTAAVDHGAVAVNHAAVTDLRRDGEGRVCGAVVETDDGPIDVRAQVVVNAAGVWVDDVGSLDGAQKAVRPARGVHVVVPRRLVGNDVAVVMPVPGRLGTVFVVPWGEFAYIGTTDTDYDGDLDTPYCTGEDVAYLLASVNASLTVDLDPSDVAGTWGGLRPLPADGKQKRTVDLSRRHRVRRSGSGLITVSGGKLTTWRQMAEDTVDEVLASLGRRERCRTRTLRLRGAVGHRDVADGGLGAHVRDHLVARHGSEAATVIAMARDDPDLAQPLVPGLPYLRAEVLYAVEHEMALTVDDVLARRTRARLLARDASADAAEAVADLMAARLGWDTEERDRQIEAYRQSVADERAAAESHGPAPHVPAEPFAWTPGVSLPGD